MYSKKETRIILICSLTIIFCVLAFGIIASINKVNNKFTIKKHLDDSVILIESTDFEANSSEINNYRYEYTIKDISYYILLMEASINHSAHLFNPNNLYALWNMKSDGYFIKDAAKETTMAIFIRDNIYYIEALKMNVELNDAEKDIVLEEASFIYKNLTGKQVDVTNLTMEDLYNIRYKINIITKYISTIISNGQYSETDLDIDGTYYTSLLEKYKIEIFDIWDDVEFGDITITREQED